MTDNETIAAILATGMLTPLPVPARDESGNIFEHEQARIVLAVSHAVGLYRSVLEGLRMRSGAQPNEQAPKPSLRPIRSVAAGY
jgi:hypothetical protein